MEGWIKIHRKIAENDVWLSEPFSRGQAWVDLIMIANRKPGYFKIRGNRIDVNIGQVGRSASSLAHRWRWSRSKVERYLEELQKEQQITQQKSNITTLITILNYSQYQVGEPQNVQQTSTNKKQTVSNVKNSRVKGGEKKDRLDLVKKQYLEWHNESNNPVYKKFLLWMLKTEVDNVEVLLLMDGQIDQEKFIKLKNKAKQDGLIENLILAMANHEGITKKKSFYLTLSTWIGNDKKRYKK